MRSISIWLQVDSVPSVPGHDPDPESGQVQEGDSQPQSKVAANVANKIWGQVFVLTIKKENNVSIFLPVKLTASVVSTLEM